MLYHFFPYILHHSWTYINKSEVYYLLVKMMLAEMTEKIATHQDFQEEKTHLEHFLHQHGHTWYCYPNFTVSWIVQRGAGGKQSGIPEFTPTALFLSCVSSYKVRTQRFLYLSKKKGFWKAREYMFGYLEGHCAGKELERITKRYKSHRRVGTHQIFRYINYNFRILFIVPWVLSQYNFCCWL